MPYYQLEQTVKSERSAIGKCVSMDKVKKGEYAEFLNPLRISISMVG